jgi:hypothetical protein
MKIKAPSPAMGVALLALGMASTGSAFAAASYVSNAGKVDGRDAVSSKSSTNTAAGKLVATAGAGPYKGQIPAKFLGGVVQGDADTFSRLASVADNASDVSTPISSVSNLGTLSATCGDQNSKAGVEDPVSRLTFANASAGAINLVTTVGNGEPSISVVAANTVGTATLGGSNTFHILVEQNGVDSVFTGVVRQDGRNTADARCYVYGYAQHFVDTK